MRPLLGFRDRHLSVAAITTIRQVLDDDEPFRAAVAAEADEQSVGRASWLFLTRPEGWRPELDALVAAEEELAAQDRERAGERSAERRAEQLGDLVSQLRSELAAARSDASSAREALDAQRTGRRRAEADVADLRDRLDRAEQARRDGVSDLVDARRLADERLGVVRALQRRVAELERERTRLADPVVGALGRADDALGRLRTELDAARELLTLTPDGASGPSAQRSDGSGGDGVVAGARVRREPLRLGRGVLDGTLEATDQLLRAPEVRVLVDGYNVSMEGWPHLDARTQRERLVGLLSGVVARTGANVHVVFDGDDDGRRPSVSAALSVRVHYTPAGVEADDVVISMVGELPPEVPVVVVSSDHRVRDGARAAGANVVSSAALLAWDRR